MVYWFWNSSVNNIFNLVGGVLGGQVKKAFIAITVSFGIVYLACGWLVYAIVGLMMWLTPPKTNAVYFQDAQNVQSVIGSVEQAQPSNLQVGENVQ